VLLGGVVAMRSRVDGDLQASQYSADQREPAAVTLLPDSTRTVLGGPSTAAAAESGHVAPAASAPEPHPPVPATRRVLNGDVTPTIRTSGAAASAAPQVAPPKLIRNLDAVAGAVQAPGAPVGELTASPLAPEVPRRKFDLGSADGSNELVRAQLIGAAPAPHFPEILRDRKIVGDVVVRFTVDAQGRPDLSSFTVVRTPHELMTESVRRVIPTLRFEPAHKGRIGAPAEPDQVQMSFQFNGARN